MNEHTCRCGAKLKGDRRLCPACATLAVERLVRLYRHEDAQMSLLDELAVTATRQSRLTMPTGGALGHEMPLVFHVAAAAHYRALAAFLRRSARHYRLDAYGDSLSERVRRSDTPYAYAAWLQVTAWPNVLRSDDVGEFTDELLRLTDEAWQIIDRPPDQWFAGPCPTCRADLYAEEKASMVTCGNCHNAFDVAEQRDRLLAHVDDVLATASEISRAVHLTGQPDVTPSRITNLFHRGQLVRHGRNRAGDHLYRMGDVLTVLRAQAAGKRGA